MLTTEQAIAAAADNAGPEVLVDEVWIGSGRVVALFASATEDDIVGQGPTIVDLATGQLTYPGSASDPGALLNGLTRIR